MNGDAKVNTNHKEECMSPRVGRLKLIDSLQFLSASLDKLVSGLDKFQYIKQLAVSKVGDNVIGYKSKLKLLKRKGVFPYEYIDSFDKYNDTSLPSVDKFKSSLDGNKGISDKDYT